MFTMTWIIGCQQYCDFYNNMDVNSTVTFTTTWMSTVLWRLPQLDVSTLCMDVNSTVTFTTTWCVNSMHGCQQYCDIYHNLMCQLCAWMSKVLWHLPQLDVSTLCMDVNSTVTFTTTWCVSSTHGCQQYCDFYHNMHVNNTVVFTTTWCVNSIIVYAWMSTVLWCLQLDVSTLCMDVNSTVVFTTTWCVNSVHRCQQHGDIYHNLMCQLYAWMSTVLWWLPQLDVSTLCMDVNSMVTFTTTWCVNSTHGCQQYCDFYHNMHVNSTVVFTTTWCVNSMHGCQQYCGGYHNLMYQLYAWMSTARWHLPQLDVSTLCMDVNSTVTFTATWCVTTLCMDVNSAVVFTTTLHVNSMHGCQQYCGVYHNLMCQLYAWMSTVLWYLPQLDVSQLYAWMSTVQWYLPQHGCQQHCDIYHNMDVNSTVIFTTTWMSTALWYLPWPGQLALW